MTGRALFAMGMGRSCPSAPIPQRSRRCNPVSSRPRSPDGSGALAAKDTPPAIAKTPHAFKIACDDPKVIETYDKFDFVRR